MCGLKAFAMASFAGLVLLTASGLSGCHLRGETATDEAAVLRIIVKPAPDAGIDPAQPDGIARLSEIAGVPLAHLRAMSDGAHVLVTLEPAVISVHEGILSRLHTHPAIEYAEEDRRIPPPVPR